MSKIKWINEDKHSILIVDKLLEIEEIQNDKNISKKDIFRAVKDFVKIVRNETVDKQKIRETSQKPDYYTYDLYEAISNKAFELLHYESSEYLKHNDNDIEENNNYKSFNFYNSLA